MSLPIYLYYCILDYDLFQLFYVILDVERQLPRQNSRFMNSDGELYLL